MIAIANVPLILFQEFQETFNGNYIDAEMVKAFITSIEYRQRFEP